jgi:hypothetical protein
LLVFAEKERLLGVATTQQDQGAHQERGEGVNLPIHAAGETWLVLLGDLRAYPITGQSSFGFQPVAANLLVVVVIGS